MEMLHKFLSAPIDFVVGYALPFIVVLSILVFVHEFGHYYIARRCGVKVDKFSIGFGPELFGRTDKHGTRWKFSLIPLGGYVQMFGDVDPASALHVDGEKDGHKARPHTIEEKKIAFYAQPVGKRAAIVFAGPAINYIFAIVILSFLFALQGQPYAPPIAASIIAGSPAEKAGIKPDDKILAINDVEIEKFSDMRKIVMLNLDKELDIKLVHSIGKDKWSSKPKTIVIKPELRIETDRFGFKHSSGRIGIKSPEAFMMQEHTPVSAVKSAVVEVYSISRDTLSAIGQMIMGTRSSDELGGILRIGAYAGEFAKEGVVALITFAALLSVNLGLINLFPIPMLDGGHLVMYAMEKLRGRPLTERLQEHALRVGFALLIGIMIFATWNDLVQLHVIDYVVKLVS